MNEKTFDLIAESRAALSFALRQGDTLRSKLAPLAAHVFDSADLAATAERLETLFKTCRGESVAAKTAGRKELTKAIGKAWHRMADGLKYHAGNLDLSLTFPNLASGEGRLLVEFNAAASTRRKAERAARETADAEALALFQADQQQQQIDALRAMSVDELAKSIAAQIVTWRGDAKDPRFADVAIKIAAELGCIGEISQRLNLPAAA